MAGEDFVHVRLSPAGEKMAGNGGQVRITKAHCSFLFKAGQSQRITRAYDWNCVLKDHQFEGQPIFEETAAPTDNEPAGPASNIE